MVVDLWPMLMGYDPGYPAAIDAALRVFAWAAVAAAVAAVARAVSRLRREPHFARGALLGLLAVNLVVAALALPYIPGNPRYLLFLVAPVAVFLADAASGGRWRWGLGVLIAFGAISSLAQWPGAARADARWRAFVADLRRAGVTHCYTDFHLAAKIDMISEEQVVCAADLGPTTTEYCRDYPRRVSGAPKAALIAVNTTAAEKIGRRLERLGVAYERHEFMKPVLIPERHVHPSELGLGAPQPAGSGSPPSPPASVR
jgi:hypothetical protein